MPAFLVSYQTLGENKSKVFELPEAPRSAQGVADLRATLSMEHDGAEVILINWDHLPVEADHPSVNGYIYFISYMGTSSSGNPVFGCAIELMAAAICTERHVRELEVHYGRRGGHDSVAIIAIKPLAIPTPEMMEAYRLWQTGQEDGA